MTTDELLSKRLTYILRYGAEEEGLIVDEEDFVSIDALMLLKIMQNYKREKVMKTLKEALNSRNSPRYQLKSTQTGDLVRAADNRNIHKNTCHSGSRVKRLEEILVNYISENITRYDLQHFPVPGVNEEILRRLRRKSRLNNTQLDCLLGPNVEHLNLQGCLLTPKSLKLIVDRCSSLRSINLHKQGYIIIDSNLERLLKSFKSLESINLSDCHDLSNATIANLLRYSSETLTSINLNRVNKIGQESLLQLLTESKVLCHLDIYDHPAIYVDYRSTMVEVAYERGIKLVLKDMEVIEDDNYFLPI